MPRRTSDVQKALCDKGMVPDEGHHHMYRKTVDGVTHVVTRVSHSGTDIPDSLGKLMGNQCFLQLKEFWRLVDCPMSETDWDLLIRSRVVNGRSPFLP